MLNAEASLRFMPRAMEDLSNITAYWQRNITKEEAQKITVKILRDLKELALFYPSANEIRYEPLKSQAFRFYRSGAYIAVCKKIENVIYVYHIAHEDEEYPEIFTHR